jgi:hypothetical protein
MGTLISDDKLVRIVKVLKPEPVKLLEQGRRQLRFNSSRHIITELVLR